MSEEILNPYIYFLVFLFGFVVFFGFVVSSIV